MYFAHIAKLVNNMAPNITIKFRKVYKLTALAKSSSSIPKIAVFDYDLNKVDFERKIKICNNKVIPVYTSLNFDLWLLLHKAKYTKSVSNNNDYIQKILNTYNIKDTKDIKKISSIEKILREIGLKDIKKAIVEADNIMKSKNEKDKIVLGKNFIYYDNPSMNINDFLKELFNEINL